MKYSLFNRIIIGIVVLTIVAIIYGFGMGHGRVQVLNEQSEVAQVASGVKVKQTYTGHYEVEIDGKEYIINAVSSQIMILDKN